MRLSWTSHFYSGALVVPIGITYGCKQLEPSEEARGVVHWVRIDLTAPGIAPYVTSKNCLCHLLLQERGTAGKITA